MMKDLKKFITTTIRQYLNENIYHDKPREFAKTLNNYERLILQLRGKTSIQISKIIEKWVIENENELADNICGIDGRYINCEHATEIVGQILSDAKIAHTLQVGTIDGQSHAWVKINNIIIDPTKDQFPNINVKDYEQNIYWKKTFTF